ncbi:hypothetical protein SAMN06265784_113106 [Paraburkholderia susongensis]|uniref:Uncharacterized protein n=1 Tax=Paraburkholderia susongensis TaxID=1515439 RepID=A0A1X7M1Y5_9BURK|nr:hypothetical protein SAMN06265784_113106 [Paraburkholderia susongensis]
MHSMQERVEWRRDRPPAASGIGPTFSHYHVSKAILSEETCVSFEISGKAEPFRAR